MNLYVRYFDDEKLVGGADEAYQFLCEVVNDPLDAKHLDLIRAYMNSTANFNRRIKVTGRIYYILIKTQAETLEDFKVMGQQMKEAKAHKASGGEAQPAPSHLTTTKEGWYEGHMLFKRVVFNVDTGKNEYIDTEFSVRAKASSPQHLYDRMCEHLKSRPDLDPRSQLPSAKGKNFKYTFLGADRNA